MRPSEHPQDPKQEPMQKQVGDDPSYELPDPNAKLRWLRLQIAAIEESEWGGFGDGDVAGSIASYADSASCRLSIVILAGVEAIVEEMRRGSPEIKVKQAPNVELIAALTGADLAYVQATIDALRKEPKAGP